MQVYLVYFIYFGKVSGIQGLPAGLPGNGGQPRGRPPYIGGGPAGATGRVQGPAWGREAETVRKRGPGQPSERAPGRLFPRKCQHRKGGRPGVYGGLK